MSLDQAYTTAANAANYFGRGDSRSAAERAIRERCIGFAIGTGLCTDERTVVRAAGAYFDFIMAKDQRNVRTTVLDALNEAGVD